ncbi:hypothetical protein [Sphingomonas sp.]|uniref:hypothetical protein n=1 Tax=Sphingomonas sp. TaxID=28214 RepID=UPI003D6D1CD8
MRTVKLLGCACLTLFALSISVSRAENPVSVPADKVIAAMGLKQGRWHTVLKWEDLTIKATDPAAAPPAGAAEMQKKIGTTFETDDCIGSSLAANGDLILPGIGIGGDCLNTIQIGGGHISLLSSCGTPQRGYKAVVNFNGSHTPTMMTGVADVNASVRGVDTTTKLSLVASYAGDCR